VSQELLNRAVIAYRGISDQIDTLAESKDELKEEIMKYMRSLSLRTIDVLDEQNNRKLRARVDVREGSTRIGVEEARNLLDADTFAKLAVTGEPYITLSIRPIK